MCNNKNGEGVKNSSSFSMEKMEEMIGLNKPFTEEQKKQIYDSIIEAAAHHGHGNTILETIKKCSDAIAELHEKVGNRKDSDQCAGMVALAILSDLPINMALACISLMRKVIILIVINSTGEFINNLSKK